VFPQWRVYTAELSQRAALAERQWLDSIGLSGKTLSVPGTKTSTKSQGQGSTAATLSQGVGGSSTHKQMAGSLRGALRGSSSAGGSDGQEAGQMGGVGGVFGRASAWLRRVAGSIDVQ
jgi:hypothetical protein